MLTLHQQPDRSTTYEEMRPYRFEEGLGCLSVFDAEIIAAVFRSDKFDVIHFADQYRYIAEKAHLDFGAAISALDHVPLANEGERHRQTRAEIAAVIGSGARDKMAEIEAFVASHIRQLFRSGNDIELGQDLGVPIYLKLFALWLGVDHSKLTDDLNVSQIFDMKMSLNRRRKINQNIEKLTCAFAGRQTQIPTTPECATAMNLLGNDALRGTMNLALWDVLTHNQGVRLDRIDYPASIPSTGVPFIERVAKEDVEVNGMAVAKGQRVRLYLDATTYYMTGEDNDVLFGKGKHLCLGKPMSLSVWRSIVSTLRTIPLHFTLGKVQMRKGDYAFKLLDFAWVHVHD